MNEILQPVIEWVVSLMSVLGAAGVGVAVALENLFPPIPSEVVLPAAGFAAAQGTLSLVGAVVWSTMGSVVGALALYGIGAWVGRTRLARLVEKIPGVKAADIERTEAWFERHGAKAVLLGRMVPVVRSLISIPAGLERMALGPFVAYTAIGSTAWNVALIGAGYLLGDHWTAVEGWISDYQFLVIAVAFCYLLYRCVRTVMARTNRHKMGNLGVQ